MSEQKNNPLIEKEKAIQKFWVDNQIFAKSLEATKNSEVFSFYDGPPFATGTPHYGHLVASIMKDVVPRYQTMKGKYVERRWGWDCHGLPVENLIEQELDLTSRQDIENIGIGKFNNSCRLSVLRYADIWKKTIPRLGRWVDMENDYRTMEPWYMESIWWVFKQLWDKDLIYEGYKSMHICPRCETTLSNFEVTQGYKDIKDLAVTAKFELLPPPLTPSLPTMPTADKPVRQAQAGGDNISTTTTSHVGGENISILAHSQVEGENIPTYVLAWTTTPWTLIGNVALAVGADIDYVQVEVKTKNEKLEYYILAKELVEKVFKDQEYTIVKEFKGQELVGKKYKPLFDYYQDQDMEYRENLYTIVSADFVSTTDGVGVVHIAPAFGEEDMALGNEKKLPMIQHIDETGHIKKEVGDGFAGLEVKPKDDTPKTDVAIIKYLAEKGLLFAKEKYEHSYPHCWRCDTPLLNYATSSWFVKVTEIKKDLIKNNSLVNWVPNHLKNGRFGRWLEEARDWAISRSRFWGTPLPVWRCECGEIKVIGSMAELDQEKITTGNIWAMRHGESDKNIKHLFDNSQNNYALTTKGEEQVKQVAKKLVKNKIAVIISSKVLRCQQTAEIIAQELGLAIEFDDRLNEVDPGDYQNQADNDAVATNILTNWYQDHNYPMPGGESVNQVGTRMLELYNEILKKYQDKNVLLISHGDNIRILSAKLRGATIEDFFDRKMLGNTEVEKLPIITTDLHKDIVDEIEFECHKCHHQMKRIPEVLDCWFESGSMPYAQLHYPFENKDKFKDGFPADFIAEGVDQTRGWFYTLMILSTALFDKPAFHNVIANGIVLAEDGNKMAKRLKNYPEPDLVMEKYGADALRFYLLSSPVMIAENLNFSEVGVKEAFQKVVMLTNNILKFYQLYEDEKIKPSDQSKNVLDRWLIAKLNQLMVEVSKEMNNFQLTKAVRPIQEFVDEFSTWWLRRSRERFKSGNLKDKQQALETFNFVLIEMSKVMAPFMPFMAEVLYRECHGQLESVHLDKWPKAGSIDDKLIDNMNSVRKIVEMGLAKRAEAGIKIRQPLASLKFPISNHADRQAGFQFPMTDDFIELIKDELNVKEVIGEKEKTELEFDTNLTEELKAEGLLRELIRTVNSLRKDNGLTISDQINILWESDSVMIKNVLADQNLSQELKQSTLAQELLSQVNEGQKFNLNNEAVKIEVVKI